MQFFVISSEFHIFLVTFSPKNISALFIQKQAECRKILNENDELKKQLEHMEEENRKVRFNSMVLICISIGKNPIDYLQLLASITERNKVLQMAKNKMDKMNIE